MIMPGGKVTMFAAILMFGEPGARSSIPTRAFPIYRSMIEFTGAEPVPVPIREENGFRLLGRGDAVADHAAHAALILNSPANPTGGVTPRRDRQAREGLESASRTSRSCRTRSTTS
jgi:aspartate aminotransferase